MEDRINKFREWLLIEKQFDAKKADSICSLYQRMNNFLLSKDKGKNNLFEINDVKTYNLICNKWLTGKLVSMTLKKDAVDFVKHRKLYAEFLSSDFFVAMSDEPVEQLETVETIVEEDDAETMDVPSVDEETKSEEIIVEEPIIEVKTFEETIFDKCREVVSVISTSELPKNNQNFKEKGVVFFDVANECYRIDTEQYQRIIDINSYSIVYGKAFRHDDKYLGDFSDEVSTYKTIFRLSKDSGDRIIEKSIKDSLTGYKVEYSYCLLPDLLDDFNKDIKSQINYNGKKLFTIPKSVALLFSLLKKKRLLANREYYVVDYDGDELSVTCLFTREDEDKNIRIVRKGLHRTNYSYLNYTEIAKLYLEKYCKKYNVLLSELQLKNIVESKAVLRLCESKEPILISNADGYCSIKYDAIIYRQLKEEYFNNLHLLKDEIGANNVFVINSFFESDYNYLDLFDGCEEVHQRIMNNECLWEEYLPQLSLEVIENGRFEEIALISENEYRDVLKVLNSEEVIPVEGIVILGAGKEQYRLPLKREIIGSINAQKEACLKHTSFPLDKNVQVRMEIRYKYGDEDSYKLIFYPLSSDAPFERIENAWEDVEFIDEIATPKIESVSQEMLDREIKYVINGVKQGIDRVDKIAKGWNCVREIIVNPHTNLKETQIFNSLNKLYIPRRKFFSTYMCAHHDEVKNAIKTMFETNFLSNMYQIMTAQPNWRRLFGDEEYPVVKANIERILIDMGAIYALKVVDENAAELVNNIISYFLSNNKLWQLVPLSRCIKNDRYGIFDHITERIIEKASNNKLDISDMRTISSNCWQSKEWMENLFYSENGKDAVYYIIKRTTDYILAYDIDDIRCNSDYNPRTIRDMLELLLCCTRANEYLIETANQVYFDPNSELVKNLIEKIKLIDYYMDEYSNNLSKDFVSRLNANIDKRDLYRVNEITYMLIQTLSGKERIELIGFIEDK